MKSFWIESARWGLLLLAGSLGCALVGYNFDDYKPADASGAGGTATAGTQSSAASQTSGTSGSAGGLGGSVGDGGSSSTASSTGSSGGSSCTEPTDCKDKDPCTLNQCEPDGKCTFPPEPKCCLHSVCQKGLPLDSGCVFEDSTISTQCVAEVCGANEECCSFAWTEMCVDSAKLLCASMPPSFNCMCGHTYCAEGPALEPFCDPCVHAICAQLDYSDCCTSGWSMKCVLATQLYCHVPQESCQ